MYINNFFLWLIGPACLAIIAYAIYLWYKYGKEPEISYSNDYEREVPFDYSPAIVGSLFNMSNHRPGMNHFTASILNLAQKKYLKIEKVKTKKKILFVINKEIDDYQITLIKTPSDLPDYDLEVYSILKSAAKGNKLTFSQFKRKIQKSPAKYRGKFDTWQKKTKDSIKSFEFFGEEVAGKKFGYILAATVILMIIGVFSIFILFLFGFFVFSISVFIVSLLVYLFTHAAFKVRTKKGALHLARWKALRKYMEDFSNFKEKPIADIKLWEQYLVYATALGIADKVLKAMKGMKFSKKQLEDSYLFTSMGMYSSMKFTNSISSLSTIASNSMQIDSAGGYSGGFSGGGGFGGGGGGFGAG